MRWVEFGQPCPLCAWEESHLHSLRDDGTYGVVVRRAVAEGSQPSEVGPDGRFPSTVEQDSRG